MALDLRALGTLVHDLVMGDTIRITRPGGPPVLNPDTDQLEPPPPTVIYEGPGAVLSASSMPGLTTPAAGQDWPDDSADPYRLLTPLDTPTAARDDTATVLTAAYDPTLISRSWRCVRPSQGSSIIAVRITWLDQNQPRAGGG
jgi:hypothetical protein